MNEPAAAPACISFLSDYGHVDEFAGVCRAVMTEIAPAARIVDVTHEVPAHDVRAGALTLVRAAQYLPTGVVLAVVDPGVGTERRAVAVEIGGGFLVGPDNGLLAPAVAMAGGPRRVVALTNAEYQLPAPGPTFAGRDVMAPAAAHLAAGVGIDELGSPVDPATLVPGTVPLPHEEGGEIACEVLWVDRFGNCQLNVDPDQLRAFGAEPGGSVELVLGEEHRMARWVATYAEARPSEVVLVVDSYGLVSLAVDRASAAEVCGLRAGARLTVVPPGAATGR